MLFSGNQRRAIRGPGARLLTRALDLLKAQPSLNQRHIADNLGQPRDAVSTHGKTQVLRSKPSMKHCVRQTSASAPTRLMASLLFNVSPLGPLTYIAVPGVLVVSALLASYLRAAPPLALRGASSVHPGGRTEE
jgi:hypothetical protein